MDTAGEKVVGRGTKILGRWRVPFYYGWVIVGAVVLAEFAAAGMGGGTISLYFKPIGESQGWSLLSMVGALTAQAIVGMAAAPLVGMALDRFGARPVMVWGAVAAGIGLMFLSQVQEVWHFWVMYALVGALGLSELGHLSGPIVVSKWFIRLRGRAIAIATAGTPLGAAVMSPLIGIMIATIGWRQSFVVQGVLMITAVAPVLLLLMRRTPEDVGLLPDGDREESPAQAGAPAAPQRREEATWTLKEALRTRTLWVLIVAMDLASLSAGALITFQAPFLTKEMGMSTQAASIVFSLTWTGFLISRAIWGYLVEHLPVHWCLAGAFVARGLGPIVLVALPFPFSLAPFLILYGLFGGSFQLLQAVAFANYFGRRFMGSIQGAMRPLLAIPGLVGSPLLAWLIDRSGYTPAFLLAGGLGLAAAVVALFATPPKQRLVPAGEGQAAETKPA
ncbi:MAG: MFS transporter [Chloroflexi bacterium]|nr:MFS transporter [Chloroflexota bacterium]